MKGFLATTASIVAVILTIAATARSQPAGVGTWTTKSPLPAARNETIAVAVNDKIYLIGGNFPRQKYDVAVNEEYDPATDRWRSRAPMPSGLNHLGAAVLDGKI